MVLNQTEPFGLFSSAVFQVGLLVCLSCKSFTPFLTPAVIPNSANNPFPSSNLIVLAPPVESPSALPLWNISRLPVVLLIAEVTLVTLDPIAVLTSDNAVPPDVIVTPFITMFLVDTTVPDATEITGKDVFHAVEPTCTQVLLAVFLYNLLVTCVVLIA